MEEILFRNGRDNMDKITVDVREKKYLKAPTLGVKLEIFIWFPKYMDIINFDSNESIKKTLEEILNK